MTKCVRMQQNRAGMSMPASFAMTSESNTVCMTGIAFAMPVFVCPALVLLALELSLLVSLLSLLALLAALLLLAGFDRMQLKAVQA